MPLGEKFRKLRDLKRGPDGQTYPLSEIAARASGLYRDKKISRVTQELQDAGASMEEIAQACEMIRAESDAVNRQYLSDLKDGKRTNPPFSIIEALSLFFGVETDYWRVGTDATERTRQIEREVELIELGVQAAKAIQKLDSTTEGSDESTQGTALMGALFRGLDGADSGQARAILRLALLGLQGAQEDQTG